MRKLQSHQSQMLMSPTKLAFLVAMIVLPQIAASVKGCVCFPLPTPYKAYREAKAVFVGKVLSSKDITAEEKVDDKSYTYYVRHFRFSVAESLKGLTNSEIETSAGRIDTDCYRGFTIGESYLIYADGDSLETLGTGACTRTNNLQFVSDELHYLHALMKGKPEPRIYGAVTRVDNDITRATSARVVPIEGVKIMIEGEGRKFEAVTNKEGLYSLNNVPDGRYKAKPIVSDKRTYFPTEEEFVLSARPPSGDPFEVQQGITAYASFQIGWKNSISGRILDSEGNPIERAKAAVVLASGASPLTIEEDEDDDHQQGKYEFSGLTPGKYLLSVRIRAPFADNERPTRFYYPYVENIDQATAITVGETESLERDIRLPPEYLVRQISGTLVWPDGSTLSRGWVFLADLRDSADEKRYDATSTDEFGRFSLQAFVGAEYWVHAESNSSEKGEPIKIRVGNANDPLKIIIPFPKPEPNR